MKKNKIERKEAIIKASELNQVINSVIIAIEDIYTYYCKHIDSYFAELPISGWNYNGTLGEITNIKIEKNSIKLNGSFDSHPYKRRANKFVNGNNNDYLCQEYKDILIELATGFDYIYFKYDEKEQPINISINTKNSKIFLRYLSYRELKIENNSPALNYLSNAHFDPNITIINSNQYYHIKYILQKYKNLKNKTTNINEKDFIFDNEGNLLEEYKHKSLKDIDLSKIDFDNKNISGIDIHDNLNLNINIDKIIKDLSDANIEGYNLYNTILRDFDLRNANIRKTGAIIDLATCTINKEGKTSQGTLFDEHNKFMLCDKVIKHNDIEKMGIYIKKYIK